jgi:hypothetical protein
MQIHSHTGTTSIDPAYNASFSGTTGSSSISLRVNDNAGATSTAVLEYDEPSGAQTAN